MPLELHNGWAKTVAILTALSKVSPPLGKDHRKFNADAAFGAAGGGGGGGGGGAAAAALGGR